MVKRADGHGISSASRVSLLHAVRQSWHHGTDSRNTVSPVRADVHTAESASKYVWATEVHGPSESSITNNLPTGTCGSILSLTLVCRCMVCAVFLIGILFKVEKRLQLFWGH